jgi:autotransporter-associated beta strand protein
VQPNGIISFTGATNIVLAAPATRFGYINLDGGVLATRPTITGSNGTSVLNFNGGTLRALTNNSAWITGLSTGVVKSGGAVIDTQTYTNTIPQSLIHDASLVATPDGGLLKLGSGTLIFTGTNTYTGPTTVSNGTLRLAFDNGLASNGTVTVVSGGILDMAGFSQSLISLAGNGIITNVNSGKPLTVTGTNTFSGTVAGSGALTVSGVISPAGAGVIGQETIAGNLALSGTLAVDVATDGTSDLLVTQGTLDLTGAKLAVVNTNNLSIDKQYVVLSYSNAPSAGSFSDSLLPPYWTTKNDTDNKRILLRRVNSGCVITIQ